MSSVVHWLHVQQHTSSKVKITQFISKHHANSFVVIMKHSIVHIQFWMICKGFCDRPWFLEGVHGLNLSPLKSFYRDGACSMAVLGWRRTLSCNHLFQLCQKLQATTSNIYRAYEPIWLYILIVVSKNNVSLSKRLMWVMSFLQWSWRVWQKIKAWATSWTSRSHKPHLFSMVTCFR